MTLHDFIVYFSLLWFRFLFPDLPEEGGLIPEPTTDLQEKNEPNSTDALPESPKPA